MSNVERLERVRGTTSKEVCLRLSKIAQHIPKDQAIVEIGAFEGRVTCFLAHGARHGQGAHVYGVDAWDLVEEDVHLPYRMHAGQHKAVRARMMQSHTRAKKNVSIQGMTRHLSLIRGRSSEVANDWTGGQIGLLVIDGDPRTESIKTDVAAWFPYLHDDAVIMFENYDPSVPNGVDVVTAVNELVRDGAITLDESDDLHIAIARPATTLDQGKLVLPEPGQAGPLRLEEDTEPEDQVLKAGKIEATALDESGMPTGDTVEIGLADPTEFDVKSEDDVKTELDAFAAEMGIEAEPGKALPPVPDDAYPPDATPLPEPEYEDNSDDAASSKAQHVAEHPEPAPATNDAPMDEGRSTGELGPLGVVFDDMNVKQLREHAEKIGADVKGIYKRDEVLTKIHEQQRQLDAVDELGQLGQELGT